MSFLGVNILLLSGKKYAFTGKMVCFKRENKKEKKTCKKQNSIYEFPAILDKYEKYLDTPFIWGSGCFSENNMQDILLNYQTS